MNEYRDRAAGWSHAKRTGHKNEDQIKELLDTDAEYAADLLHRMGVREAKIVSTSIGGLHETTVPGVVGKRKTKSKTDLKIFLDDGKEVKVSIKKSLGGQVYLVRAGMFIEVFEKQFGKKIPDPVKRAIQLFWAAADDAVDIIDEYDGHTNEKNYMLQRRHKSLNATTLKAYDRKLYNGLLTWFVDNACEIAKLCFSMGAVRDKKEWSDFIWYKNMLGENTVDAIFSIKEICGAVGRHAKTKTCYSEINGGTTIRLPFGFVQWHQRQLQFHHDYEKIAELLR